VLAVGDAQFQKKCLGKMRNVATSEGRTVLFVSHNLEALRAICQTGVLLEAGRVKTTGPILDVIGAYHGPQSELHATFPAATDKPSITSVRVDPVRLAAGDLAVEVHFESPVPLRPAIVGFVLSTLDGRPVFGSNMRTHPPATELEGRIGICTITVPQLGLHSGDYTASIWLGDRIQDYDSRMEAVSFAFVSPRHYPNRPPLHVIGPVDFPCHWTTRPGP